jgi:hypothetical protein
VESTAHSRVTGRRLAGPDKVELEESRAERLADLGGVKREITGGGRTPIGSRTCPIRRRLARPLFQSISGLGRRSFRLKQFGAA